MGTPWSRYVDLRARRDGAVVFWAQTRCRFPDQAGDIDGVSRLRRVIDILALFRQRRPPRRKRPATNGGWADMDLDSLGGSIASAPAAHAEVARPARRQRPRREDPAPAPVQEPELSQRYLAAHGLQKSYG